jgi:hypothetical protein
VSAGRPGSYWAEQDGGTAEQAKSRSQADQIAASY